MQLILLSLILFSYGNAIELTFELPDRREQCFSELIEQNTECSLEFQVITGGNYDIDVNLFDPDSTQLYSEKRKEYGLFSFTTLRAGEYTFCFNNEFSTVTHKLIYFEFMAGDPPIDPAGTGDKHTALTHMETKAVSIHNSLNMIVDYQTHHRIRETHGRRMAERVNERVLWWSLLETGIIVVISISQILVLRWFFVDKKSAI